MSSPSSPARQQLYQIDDARVAVALQEPEPDVQVPEALVHDLWRHQRFDTEGLTTTDEAPVRILHPGRPNTDAGPDFQNAHVRIGDMDWRGHVEIHTASGGWYEHEHNTDPRYDSVVLHVTLHADMWTGGLLRADESTVPEIVLYPRLDTPLRELLHTFHTRSGDDDLPCASRWDEVPDDTKHDWVAHLARERLSNKRDRLAERSDASLEERLHERLFAGLGYSKNDEPMTTLARRLPPSLVREVEDPRDREALHLGVAGLLPEPKDLLDADRETADYAMDLRDRYRRLQVRFEVPEMESTSWTFFRLRPNNFPPLRLAQAAAWYADDALLSDDPIPQLRSRLQADDPAHALREMLAASPPEFWRTHYHLEKSASEHEPDLGPSRRDTLLVNAVVPALLLDADRRSDAEQTEVAIDVLRSLSAPRDSVLRRFRDLGTAPSSAYEAQGLHQLYREYCTQGGCLDCAIGRHLLNS
jgi:hypothetical protein